MTIDGPPLLGRAGQVGVTCKFPFKFAYFGMTFGPYNACTDYLGTLYCATEVDSDHNALNYGACDPNCVLSGEESKVFNLELAQFSQTVVEIFPETTSATTITNTLSTTMTDIMDPTSVITVMTGEANMKTGKQ